MEHCFNLYPYSLSILDKFSYPKAQAVLPVRGIFKGPPNEEASHYTSGTKFDNGIIITKEYLESRHSDDVIPDVDECLR